MLNRKEIAHDLDRAAERAGHVAEPATPKQCWFLAGLMAERGETASQLFSGNTNFALSKRQASFFIDLYLREKAQRQAA